MEGRKHTRECETMAFVIHSGHILRSVGSKGALNGRSKSLAVSVDVTEGTRRTRIGMGVSKPGKMDDFDDEFEGLFGGDNDNEMSSAALHAILQIFGGSAEGAEMNSPPLDFSAVDIEALFESNRKTGKKSKNRKENKKKSSPSSSKLSQEEQEQIDARMYAINYAFRTVTSGEEKEKEENPHETTLPLPTFPPTGPPKKNRFTTPAPLHGRSFCDLTVRCVYFLFCFSRFRLPLSIPLTLLDRITRCRVDATPQTFCRGGEEETGLYSMSRYWHGGL